MEKACERNRLIGLDLFRFTSAFIVLLFHSHIGANIECQYGIFNNFISMGAVYMTGFFMLSGFTLFFVNSCYDLSNLKDVGIFYKKRFVGIMPLYYFTAIFYIAFCGNEGVFDNLLLAPIEITGIQSVFSTIWDRTHNGGTWFISCLVICYLIYPYIQQLVKQFSNKTKWICISILSCILLYSPFIVWRFNTFSIYTNPFFRLVEFFIGVLLCSLYKSYRDMARCQFFFKWKALIIENIALITLISIAFYLGISPGNYMLYNWIALPLFALIIISSSGLNVRSKFIGGDCPKNPAS